MFRVYVVSVAVAAAAVAVVVVGGGVVLYLRFAVSNSRINQKSSFGRKDWLMAL